MTRLEGAAPVAVTDKLMLSPAEAAGLCGVGLKRALQLVHLGEARGGWRAVRVGGRYYVPSAWLRTWVAALQDGAEIELGNPDSVGA